jgi:hypothetical protein
MSDGIIAISRMEEETKESEEEKAAEAVQAKRRKSRAFADFVLTDYGIAEEGTTSMAHIASLQTLPDNCIVFLTL